MVLGRKITRILTLRSLHCSVFNLFRYFAVFHQLYRVKYNVFSSFLSHGKTVSEFSDPKYDPSSSGTVSGTLQGLVNVHEQKRLHSTKYVSAPLPGTAENSQKLLRCISLFPDKFEAAHFFPAFVRH